MATYRIERLNKEFLRLLAEALVTSAKNPAAAEAILTQVDCSRDLSHAKVYFTLLDEKRKEEVLGALRNAAPLLRGMLGRTMHIRQAPELRFIFDDSEMKARAIDALIDRAVREDDELRRRAEAEGREPS